VVAILFRISPGEWSFSVGGLSSFRGQPFPALQEARNTLSFKKLIRKSLGT